MTNEVTLGGSWHKIHLWVPSGCFINNSNTSQAAFLPDAVVCAFDGNLSVSNGNSLKLLSSIIGGPGLAI